MKKKKTSKTKRGSHLTDDTHGLSVSASDLKMCRDQKINDTQCAFVPAHCLEAGGSHWPAETHNRLAKTCLQLRMLQSYHSAVIRAQLGLLNQARSRARQYMRWQVDLPESTRTKINAAAAKLIKQIEKNPMLGRGHGISIFILDCYEARIKFEKQRKNIEKEMRRLAESLPVWGFWQNIKGAGSLGLAIIIGETGNLSDYANPAKVWKHVGLAPRSCYLMTTKKGEEAVRIPRQKRSAIWTVGDSLIKGNRNNGEVLEYAALYNTRKAYERDRNPELTKMHAHRRAQRYMEKRLIRNLWQAWR